MSLTFALSLPNICVADAYVLSILNRITDTRPDIVLGVQVV